MSDINAQVGSDHSAILTLIRTGELRGQRNHMSEPAKQQRKAARQVMRGTYPTLARGPWEAPAWRASLPRVLPSSVAVAMHDLLGCGCRMRGMGWSRGGWRCQTVQLVHQHMRGIVSSCLIQMHCARRKVRKID